LFSHPEIPHRVVEHGCCGISAFIFSNAVKTHRVARALDAQNFTRKTGQNMIEYFYQKLSKCNRAEMSDNEIIQWIVRGIGNDRYRDYLGPLSNYKKPADLLPHLMSANDYIERDKEKNTQKLNENSAVKQTRTTATSDMKKTSLICFRCRVTGHTSKECTKKLTVTCFRCSKPGHKSYECRSKPNVNDKTSSSVPQVPSSTNENGKQRSVFQLSNGTASQNKYFKTAIINGERVRAYIDMGAACVAMRKSEADRLKINYDDTTREEFVGYGFGRVSSLGRFKTTLIIDKVSAYVTINVVPDDVQEISLFVWSSVYGATARHDSKCAERTTRGRSRIRRGSGPS